MPIQPTQSAPTQSTARPRFRPGFRPGLIAAAALAALAGLASGQDALGDGRALDNNPSVNSGRYNAARPNFADEVRFRNAIVTGNAPGGASFRGDVGYRAPGEFTGSLASDDLYSFRRDSVFSGLGARGIRGTDALRFQFALTTGGSVPPGVASALTIDRSDRSPLLRPAGLDRPGIQSPYAGECAGTAALDSSSSVGSLFDALRAPSAYTTNRGLTPTLLSQGLDETTGNIEGIFASPLRGVRVETIRTGERPAAEPTEPTTQATPRGITPATSRADVARPSGADQLTRPPSGLAAAPRVQTAYDQILGAIAANAPDTTDATSTGIDAAADTDTRPLWQQRLEALRQRIALNPRPQGDPFNLQATDQNANNAGNTNTDTDDSANTDFNPLDRSSGDTQTDDNTEDAQPGLERSVFVFDPNTLRLLREGGEPINVFIDPNAPATDLYTIHMQAGTNLLVEGRYFDAEERFTRAISARPDDVTAQVGRVHAQIGAGLYLSAATNLHTLLTQHPELVGARFGASLLPSEERTAIIMARLRDLLGLGANSGRSDPRMHEEAGLLLAYMGRQTGNASAVKTGLDAAHASIAEQTDGKLESTREGRLLLLLERVWTQEDAKNAGDAGTDPAPAGGDAPAD